MTSPAARAGRVGAALAAMPTALAVIAEAAWISVVAGLFQSFALRNPVLGIPAFALFVTAGVVAARWPGRRLGPRWPAVAVLVTLGAAVTAWLASPEVRAILLERGVAGLADAVAAHPGALFAAVAMLRGFAHARLPADADTIGRLVWLGIPGLAVTAIVGGMSAEPWRGRFLADAQVATIVYLAASTLALALARLTAIGAGSGFDWRRNPAWVGLLVLLVASAAAIAIPLSLVAGPVIQLLLGVAIGPLLVLGLVAGFDRRSARILAVSVAVVLVVAGVLGLVTGADAPIGELPPGVAVGDASPEPSPGVVIGGAGLLLVLAALAILVLARLWMRRAAPSEDEVDETRTIDRGEPEAVARARRLLRPRFRRRPGPTDAVTAYRALIEDLEPRPAVRRDPAETPAEHARRLRRQGHADLSLDLLAADYALASFGGVPLSAAEERRAVERGRALRRRLGRGTGSSAGSWTGSSAGGG